MNSSSKDVQNSKNESSGQNFVEKGDEFGVKIAEIKDKIEDACDENLSLKNLFVYKKLKENQIFHNVVKKDKAMDAVDFVDLVSSVEVDAIEDKNYIFHEQLDKREKIVMIKRHIITRFLMSSLALNVWIFDEVYCVCVSV
ncbi:hypothetical protein WN944_018270 [Citrus x changshan-huyou]|uniref:Uncharacterized protein n=1 Tax=Citrus x changshan-huyou TaxID=2935761 RepID=A0AAP0LUF4_9ROSI